MTDSLRMKGAYMTEEKGRNSDTVTDIELEKLAARVTSEARVKDNAGGDLLVQPQHFLRLGAALRTQDNRCTSYPMYIVRDRRKSFCDGSDADITTWLDKIGCEVGSALEEKLDDLMYAGTGYNYEENAITYAGNTYVRAYYRVTHEYVTTCLTQDGADSYIRRNAHNLHDPYVYVASGHDNDEWRILRAMLLHLGGRDFSDDV